MDWLTAKATWNGWWNLNEKIIFYQWENISDDLCAQLEKQELKGLYMFLWTYYLLIIFFCFSSHPHILCEECSWCLISQWIH